jgi:hypothetical protein
MLKPPISSRVEEADRTCLGCGRRFPSTWIGNRQCHQCKKVTDQGNPVGDEGITHDKRRKTEP